MGFGARYGRRVFDPINGAVECVALLNPPDVQTFRVSVTQVTLLVAALLIGLRQRLVDHDRLRLLAGSRESLENLKHFQAQMVQTEKLVSLGQLAAGAAHEINNPLTGILGYSDLLVDDPALGERQRVVAEKIRTLARRIKTLVTSLLSFARRVPSEKLHLDLNQVIGTALHLSNLDLRGKHIQVETYPDIGFAGHPWRRQPGLAGFFQFDQQCRGRARGNRWWQADDSYHARRFPNHH